MYLYPDKNNSVNGIVSYFWRFRMYDEIKAIASSETSGYEKNNVLDITSPMYWASSSHSTGIIWIGISFPHYTVKVSHYTIRQYTGAGSMPKSWILQGSNDGNSWYDIEYRTSDGYCHMGTILDTFEVPEANQSYYQQYRLYKNGWSCLHYDYWRLAGIELFGNIYSYDFSNIRFKMPTLRISYPVIKIYILIFLFSK